MNEALEELVSSLLYEGYALYPYTPGATKNATPTPFGIVYPPAYAKRNPATFDHLRIECVLEAGEHADPEVGAAIRFLHPSGERHKAVERELALEPTSLGELIAGGAGVEFDFPGANPVRGRARLRAEAIGDGLFRIRACVHNTTRLGEDEAARMERKEALVASMLSTHIVVETSAGKFVSPLERDGVAGAAVEGCSSLNTFPVLASPEDDAVLGAAIVLPDHPRIAPESLGNLFDNTEIEEALVLHVQALSDSEREEIAAQDPAVREMIERAAAATPKQVLSLHGLLKPVDPGEEVPPLSPGAGEVPQWSEPGSPAAPTPDSMLPPDPGPAREPGHPNPGEDLIEADGKRFRKGAKVVLRPGVERDVYDKLLDGRTATIERLYFDYEDGVHIAVTIDDDPAQELFRETGRYLFFKARELETVEAEARG